MEIHDLKTVNSQQWTVNRWIRSIVLLTLLSTVHCALYAVSDGYVVKVESSSVYLDWGAASTVKSGDQFDVYRPGESLKHPVTGEILGQAEKQLGQGVIDTVQEKYSTGKIVGPHESLRTGDRTRWKERMVISPMPPVVQGGGTTASVPVSRPASAVSPQELWRSEPISREATGIAVGDVDGDGKPELVVSYRNQIEVFRWNGLALESIALLDDKSYRNFLAVEVGSLSGAPRAQIFGSYFMEGSKRAKTVIFDLEGQSFKEAGRMDGFVRAFDRVGGKRELVWQDISLARELRIRQPAYLVTKDGKYKEGSTLRLPRTLQDQQLFGFGWGDWDKDGSEDFAVLQAGERLRVFFNGGAKWSARDAYGGSRLDFNWEDEQIGSVSSRLLSRELPDHSMQLLVPHNISATPIRLARLKIFKQSELFGFGWNGLEMAPQWNLQLAGQLADYGVADLMGKGAPQLWVAAVGAGDKTVLISFQLP